MEGETPRHLWVQSGALVAQWRLGRGAEYLIQQDLADIGGEAAQGGQGPAEDPQEAVLDGAQGPLLRGLCVGSGLLGGGAGEGSRGSCGWPLSSGADGRGDALPIFVLAGRGETTESWSAEELGRGRPRWAAAGGWVTCR